MHYYPILKTFSGSLITLIGPPGSLWGGFGPSGPWHSLPWQSPGVALSIVTSLVNKVMKMMYLQWQPLDWSTLTVNVDSPISLEILTFKSIMIILGTIGFGNLNEFSENSGLWPPPFCGFFLLPEIQLNYWIQSPLLQWWWWWFQKQCQWLMTLIIVNVIVIVMLTDAHQVLCVSRGVFIVHFCKAQSRLVSGVIRL